MQTATALTPKEKNMNEKSIDNYALSLFKECPYKYHLRINKQLVSCKPNLPAQFGIAIHEGLASHYNGNSIEDAVVAFDNSWQEFEGLDDKYSRALGVMILAYYVKQDILKPLHVEVGIAAPTSSDWVYTGRVDLIAEFDNTLYVIDHKTRAKSLGTFSIEPNYQMIGYAYGVQQTLGLEYPPPIMVNLINVSTRKSNNEFNLRMVHHTKPSDIDNFLNNVAYYTANIDRCVERSSWPRLGMEYHCAWCEFKELCIAPHLEDRLVESRIFERKEWRAYD